MAIRKSARVMKRLTLPPDRGNADLNGISTDGSTLAAADLWSVHIFFGQTSSVDYHRRYKSFNVTVPNTRLSEIHTHCLGTTPFLHKE